MPDEQPVIRIVRCAMDRRFLPWTRQSGRNVAGRRVPGTSNMLNSPDSLRRLPTMPKTQAGRKR